MPMSGAASAAADGSRRTGAPTARVLRRAATRAVAAAAILLTSACFAGYGFQAGGLPRHIRTAAVLPFENETPLSELQSELTEVVRTQLQRRLGVRNAPEARADAVVRGTIVRYDPDVPIAFSADPNQGSTARRKLSLVVDVEIVDQSDGSVLFQQRGLRGEGEYGEGAEAAGRREAINRIVTQIVEGAQSQW
jgi:hypothetical protein